MSRVLRRQDGMTVSEVLSASLITALILTAGLAVYRTAIVNNARNLQTQQTLASAQQALQVMESDVLEARGIGVHPDYPDASRALVLSMPLWDANGVITASSDTVVYYLDGDALKRRVLPVAGSPRATADGQVLLRNATDSSAIFTYSEGNAGSLVSVTPSSAEVVEVHLTAMQEGTAREVNASFRMRNQR